MMWGRQACGHWNCTTNSMFSFAHLRASHLRPDIIVVAQDLEHWRFRLGRLWHRPGIHNAPWLERARKHSNAPNSSYTRSTHPIWRQMPNLLLFGAPSCCLKFQRLSSPVTCKLTVLSKRRSHTVCMVPCVS